MNITTSDGKILFNSEECEVPDFWPFKLINSVFDNDKAWQEAYLPGIIEVVNELKDYEKTIIILRFTGLNGREIADIINRSKSRVYQVEHKVLRILRNPMRRKRMIAVSTAEFNQVKDNEINLMNELKRWKKVDIDMEMNKLLSIPIEELDLSIRSFNCLKRGGINTVGDIINKSQEDIVKLRNLGRRSFEEVRSKLAEFGIDLDENVK